MADTTAPVRASDADDEPAVGPTAGGSAPARASAVTIVVAAAIGLVAAATLLVEKIALLSDPDYTPSCSINPVVSCGSVMTSWQAEVFGVPNPLIGVAAFGVVLATGVAVLAGARLAGWYWTGLLAGTVLGVGFIHWLAFQSMFRIGALCPYCMVVWVVTMVLFVTVLRHVLRLRPSTEGAARVLDGLHVPVVVAWVLAVASVALYAFWDSWMAMI